MPKEGSMLIFFNFFLYDGHDQNVSPPIFFAVVVVIDVIYSVKYQSYLVNMSIEICPE